MQSVIIKRNERWWCEAKKKQKTSTKQGGETSRRIRKRYRDEVREQNETMRERKSEERERSMLLLLRTLARFPPCLLSESSRLLPSESRDGSSSLCGRLSERERVVVGFGVETRERVVDETEEEERDRSD